MSERYIDRNYGDYRSYDEMFTNSGNSNPESPILVQYQRPIRRTDMKPPEKFNNNVGNGHNSHPESPIFEQYQRPIRRTEMKPPEKFNVGNGHSSHPESPKFEQYQRPIRHTETKPRVQYQKTRPLDSSDDNNFIIPRLMFSVEYFGRSKNWGNIGMNMKEYTCEKLNTQLLAIKYEKMWEKLCKGGSYGYKFFWLENYQKLLKKNFSEDSEKGDWALDLHMVENPIMAFWYYHELAKYCKQQKYAYIIVGKGHHSVGGVSKLRGLIHRELNALERKWSHCSGNTGILKFLL